MSSASSSKPGAGPERVDSKSFNAERRGAVVRRFDSPVDDSFFGRAFALVAFDHYPLEPVWSSTKFLKKPTKSDLYEAVRAAPLAHLDALLAGRTEDIVRRLAKISGGQRTHHTGDRRWSGLVSALPLAEGTEFLVRLIERLHFDHAVLTLDAPAVRDSGEYNKTDFTYGPNVKGRDVLSMLWGGLEWYWALALGGRDETVADRLDERLLTRARKALPLRPAGAADLTTKRFERPRLDEAFRYLTRDFNARCGLDAQHAMVPGAGY